MSKKILKISYCGSPDAIGPDSKDSLVVQILENISGLTVKIVHDHKVSDMILAYPYGSGSIFFKLKWFLFKIIKNLFNIQDCTQGLRWILGVGAKPTLFISHENLDRPYWWRMYGSLIIQSKLPRLTYWPKSIDPEGARFPYWFNYVDWPQYPRPNFYSRFGMLYRLDALMSPLKEDFSRKNEIILIASHLEHPRASILQRLSRAKVVKVFGRAGAVFQGGKYLLMKDYKFSFCCENSLGFGYDTEKIPESWMAGCIPCGVFPNPYSDFNPEVLYGSEFDENVNAYRKPLLLKEPNLIEIEEYVKIFIEQYGLGDTNLSRGNSIS